MRRILIAAAFVAPVTVSGHHGWSEYDASKALKP